MIWIDIIKEEYFSNYTHREVPLFFYRMQIEEVVATRLLPWSS
jgi:hypothetical protein